MSLINEALKKAQRQHQDPSSTAAAVIGVSSEGASRRGAPAKGQMIILLGAGAAVLIVLSVVVTVYLVNRTPSANHPSTTATPKTLAPVDLNAPSPVIVAPVIPAPKNVAEDVTSAAGAKTLASADSPSGQTSQPSEAPAIVTPAKSSPPSPNTANSPEPAVVPSLATVTAQPDIRIQNFVDAIRIMGIRASGKDSKAMMNDKVYRLNDFVDRTLGVRLMKVDSDALTFVDANGVTYTKNY